MPLVMIVWRLRLTESLVCKTFRWEQVGWDARIWMLKEKDLNLYRVKISRQNWKKISCQTGNEVSLGVSFFVYDFHILSTQNSAFQSEIMNCVELLSYSFLNAVDVICNKQKGQEVLSLRGCKTYLMLSIASGILTKGQMWCFQAGILELWDV